MALITTGNWVAGDDLRVIKALGLPFGSYTLKCTQDCMNELEGFTLEASAAVVALLDRYDAAETAQIAADLADTEGKILVKADVLEWEANKASVPSGPQLEIGRVRTELGNYFAFCSCMGGLQSATSYVTPLIRS